MTYRATLAALATFAGAALSSLGAQVPAALAAERAEYARWLSEGATSPFGALALQRIGKGVTVGEGGEVPVPGLPLQRVREQNGAVRTEGASGTRVLRLGVPASINGFALVATGVPTRRMIAVFGPPRERPLPRHFPFAAALVDTVELLPPTAPGQVTLLASDGSEVVATEAGRVMVTIDGKRSELLVRRLPGSSPDESELEIYFRDATNIRGSYPSGRFVNLIPLAGQRYVLDFNRARNPFCSYSSVFPCPAPWPGNGLTGEVKAGEMYEPGEQGGQDGRDGPGKEVGQAGQGGRDGR